MIAVPEVEPLRLILPKAPAAPKVSEVAAGMTSPPPVRVNFPELVIPKSKVWSAFEPNHIRPWFVARDAAISPTCTPEGEVPATSLPALNDPVPPPAAVTVQVPA